MHTRPAASSDLHSQTRGHGLGATPLRWLLIACASLIGALGVLVMPATSLGQVGITWTSQTSAADSSWSSVTYGSGLFVAVANTGTNNRVMTSPDGITWTSRTSAANNDWRSVTYGSGLFVAVAQSGSGNRVMTSPDGITWTSQTSAADNQWTSVTYGNGLFVAVAEGGLSNQVMTSPDGITWTGRTSAVGNWWASVTYGNGMFVAVAATGSNNRVMTSPDGITWTSRTSAADNWWRSVTYGNGLFVAVAFNGSPNQVMTSPDGITWTSRTSTANNGWFSVTYGNGLFVAVGSGGSELMTSPDGITWTSRTSAADNQWTSVTYGNGLFVAVANTGTNNRVMTSGGPGTVTSCASPPEGPLGVSINDGNRYTNTPTVTLSVVWPTCTTRLAVSNDGGFRRAESRAVDQSIRWALDSSGPERLPKTVYVRFDGVGANYTDDIILDETAPVVSSASASVGSGASEMAASRRRVHLTLRASDKTSGVAFMQVTTSKRKPGTKKRFARSSVVRTAGSTLHVRVQDRAANWSKWRPVRIR